MAWDSGGDWTGQTVNRLSTILAQLCTALNEREEAITGVQSVWPHINKTKPTPADLSGVPVFRSRDFALSLQSAIGNLAEYDSGRTWNFVNEADATYWTEAALLADIGFGASWITPTRAQEVALWHQIRAALEKLKYFRVALTLTNTRGSTASAYVPVSTGTVEDAWDAAAAAAQAFQGYGSCQIRGGRSLISGVPYYGVTINETMEYSASWTAASAGSPYSAILRYGQESDSVSQDPMQVNIGGASYLCDSPFDSQPYYDNFIVPAGLFTASPQTLAFTVTVPDDHPFNSTDQWGQSSRYTWLVSLGSYLFYRLEVGTDLTYG